MLLWQQLAGMEKQIAEARQLLASPEQQLMVKAGGGGDDNSVLTLVGLSTIEGDDREDGVHSIARPFTPSSFSVASTMTAASHNFTNSSNSQGGRFFFNAAPSSGRDKQRFFEAASLSLALSNDGQDEAGVSGIKKIRRTSSKQQLASPQRMLRFPIRQHQSPLAATGGSNKTSATEARRESERALQLKHGLSSQVPLLRPKRAVNLQIIKSPIVRQVHGNRNVYDQAKFTWVPSKGVSGDPLMKNKTIRDERFQTAEDLKLGRQMFGVAYY